MKNKKSKQLTILIISNKVLNISNFKKKIKIWIWDLSYNF